MNMTEKINGQFLETKPKFIFKKMDNSLQSLGSQNM